MTADTLGIRPHVFFHNPYVGFPYGVCGRISGICHKELNGIKQSIPRSLILGNIGLPIKSSIVFMSYYNALP